MRPKPKRSFARDILTAEEVGLLLRSFSRRSSIGLRNRALITVLYRSGIRIAEALALELRDLDPAAGTLNVRHGKGDKQRIVAMDDGAWSTLQLWLDRRRTQGLNGTVPIFCTLQGHPIHQAYVRGLLARHGRKAGIAKRVHAHGFRHIFAIESVREGVHMTHIQQALGHTSLSTTAAYLARVSPQEMIDAFRRRRWTPPDQEPAASGNRLTAT